MPAVFLVFVASACHKSGGGGSTAGIQNDRITQFQTDKWTFEQTDGAQAPRSDSGRVRLESVGATGAQPRAAVVSTTRGQFSDFSAQLELARPNSSTTPADYSGWISIGIVGTTVASSSLEPNQVGRTARIGLRASGNEVSLFAQVLDGNGNPIEQSSSIVGQLPIEDFSVRIQVDTSQEVVRFFSRGQLVSTYVPTTLDLPADSALTIGAEGRNFLVFADELQAVRSASSDTSFTLQLSKVGPNPATWAPGVVQFLFTLRDGNDSIVNLDASQLVADNLLFQENGIPIDRVESNPIFKRANLPQDVVVVLDYSESMRRRGDIASMVAGAKNLCSAIWAINPANRIQLWEFHDSSVPASRLVSVPPGQGTNGNWLNSSRQATTFTVLDQFSPYNGFSRVYDAVYEAMNASFNEAPRTALHSVVFLTDGSDTGSFTSLAILADSANNLQASLYPIDVGAPELQARQLRRLASDTGGDVYTTDGVNDLAIAFGDLSGDIGSLYSASYTSSRTNSSTRVELDLALSLPGATTKRQLPIPVTADLAIFAGDTREGILDIEQVSFTGNTAQFLARARFTPRTVSSFAIGNYVVSGLPTGVSATVSTRRVQTGLLSSWVDFTRSQGIDRTTGPDLRFGDFGDFLEIQVTGIPTDVNSIRLDGVIVNTDLLPLRYRTTTSGSMQQNGDFSFTVFATRPSTGS